MPIVNSDAMNIRVLTSFYAFQSFPNIFSMAVFYIYKLQSYFLNFRYYCNIIFLVALITTVK